MIRCPCSHQRPTAALVVSAAKGKKVRSPDRLLAVNHSPTGTRPDGGLPVRHDPSLPRSGDD